MIIQVYAFTDPKTALAAVKLGVDHIGFVVGKYNVVPAELSFAEAREIVVSLPPQTTSVALTMATNVKEILRMVEAVKPNILHISSDVELVSVDMMREIRSKMDAGIRLMKAIPVQDEGSIALARRFEPVSDLILLDTKREGSNGVGATGLTHDWNVSRRIVESVNIPVILAGGLSAENVAASMRRVQPWGVDSDTWTNREGSDVDKDLDRIEAFVRAIRSVAEGES